MAENRRPHSRSGGASGQGAQHGARQAQPFSGAGHLTGRPPAEQQDDQATGSTQQQQQQQAYQQQQPPAQQQPQQAYQQQQPPAQQQPQQQEPQVDSGDLEQVRAERDQFREHLQRLAAEFDNFRKRAEREKTQAAAAADAKLLGELLVVLDDFERALSQAQSTDSALVQGIMMTRDRLWNVLQQHGLSEIEAQGQFDPHLHEAMLMQPDAATPEGHIVNVVQKGYRLGDRVLRHSRVVVSAGKDGGS